MNENSLFLVSGGGRGITAQCIIELAKLCPCKFILLGRSQLKNEPEWANNITDEIELKKQSFAIFTSQGKKPKPVEIDRLVKAIFANREISSTLQTIQQLGGQAEYLSIDITDRVSLSKQLSNLVNQLGQVTGIIHGAGVLADKLIENKAERDFERVYATKIEGLKNLLNCVNPEQLKHLILFSSAAGFYGNIGQSDYAIANEILNKFAYQFKHQYPNCQVTSFNWGPWDSGMVTPELKKVFARREISLIPVEVGTQIFVQQLITEHSTTAQVLVGSSLVTPTSLLDSNLNSYRIRRKLNLANSPILQDHVIGENPVLPVAFVNFWLANTAEQIYPGYHFFACHNYKVLKGIIFDDTLADEYILDLKEINKEKSLRLSASIWSKTKAGKNRYHYQSEIELKQQKPNIPKYSNFNYNQDRQFENLAPYQDGTLFHKQGFQGIKKVLNITTERLTVECCLPKLEANNLGQFSGGTFNAIAADIQLQSMLIWVRHFYNAGSLPLRCQYSEHFRDIPEETIFYVSLEVQSHSNTKLVAKVISHDLEGNVYSQVFGAEVTISQQLNRLFDTANSRVIQPSPKVAIDTNLFNSFWRKLLGRPHPVAESLYAALFKQFVGNIFLEDSQDFYALDKQPRLYLANHQVAIESILFSYAVSPLSNSLINTVTKIEHQQSWMSELFRQLSAYPQVTDPKLNLYFDRQDPRSMFELLSKTAQKIEKQDNSLLVHVAGTRSISCRQPVKDLSAVFIDLAIQLNIPIIPVKFVGGLPIEPLTTTLEFPWRYTHQDYYLGKAIHPQTLQNIGNLERKKLILHRLNNLGIAFAKMSPHNSNSDFEREIKLWRKKTGVSEVRAVFYKLLEKITNPPPEILTLITGIQQGYLKSDDTPERTWLKNFAEWLIQPHLV